MAVFMLYSLVHRLMWPDCYLFSIGVGKIGSGDNKI